MLTAELPATSSSTKQAVLKQGVSGVLYLKVSESNAEMVCDEYIVQQRMQTANKLDTVVNHFSLTSVPIVAVECYSRHTTRMWHLFSVQKKMKRLTCVIHRLTPSCDRVTAYCVEREAASIAPPADHELITGPVRYPKSFL